MVVVCLEPTYVNGRQTRLGYAVASAGRFSGIAVYAESPLPPGRVAPVQRNSAFSDLSFALYLGRKEAPASLIEASTPEQPLSGPTASAVVPFGDSEFTFVATSTKQLAGALSSDLWWLIVLLGIAATLGAAVVSERLARRRQDAETLAFENGRLYAQQRGVAEALQHALLPEGLPDVPGIVISARYLPGMKDLDIGGDWYDIIALDDHRLLFVVGDVSGRGLRAATIMASLRYAIRAYALQGDPPATIFSKLAALLDITRDRHFATVLCALIDTNSNEITFVNAGHPEPLLGNGKAAQFVQIPVGPPIGVPGPKRYLSKTMSVVPGTTLVGYTDGLIERRGEQFDTGLTRLLDAVKGASQRRSLDDLLNDIVADLSPDGSSDDIAILGLRWQT